MEQQASEQEGNKKNITQTQNPSGSSLKGSLLLRGFSWPEPRQEEHDEKHIEKSIFSLAAVLLQTRPQFYLTDRLHHSVSELQKLGMGLDVSDEQFALHLILSNTLDNLTVFVAELYGSSGVGNMKTDTPEQCDRATEKILEKLNKDDTKFSTGNRGSWCLDYVLRILYHAAEISDKQRKEIKIMYKNLWHIILSPEFIDAVNCRNKIGAHFSNSGYLVGDQNEYHLLSQLPDTLNIYTYLDWMNKALRFYHNIERVVFGEGQSSNLNYAIMVIEEKMLRGLGPLTSQYEDAARNKNEHLLQRVSPTPDFNGTINQRPSQWRGACGSMFLVEKLDDGWGLSLTHPSFLGQGNPGALTVASSMKDLHDFMLRYVLRNLNSDKNS